MSRNLKEHLNKINDFILDKNNTVFIDYPLYFNVGDLLIMHGSIKFFEENNINIKYNLCKENFSISKLRKIINNNTTIFLQGGGNFGDLYPAHQKLREQIIKNFPHNRIIMLPQSVHFEKNENLNESMKVFNQHKNIYLLARDKVSLNILSKFSDKSVLMPDMAHYLYDHLPKLKNKKNKKLFFLRKDKEGIDIQKSLFVDNNDIIDWDNLINKSDISVQKSIKKRFKYSIPFLTPILDNKNYDIWKKKSFEIIERSCNYFLQYDEIVTSRLHAHILADLLHIPSRIIDNNYKKNSLYYTEWTSNNSNHALYSQKNKF